MRHHDRLRHVRGRGVSAWRHEGTRARADVTRRSSQSSGWGDAEPGGLAEVVDRCLRPSSPNPPDRSPASRSAADRVETSTTNLDKSQPASLGEVAVRGRRAHGGHGRGEQERGGRFRAGDPAVKAPRKRAGETPVGVFETRPWGGFITVEEGRGLFL